MRVLIDVNVLVRAHQPSSGAHKGLNQCLQEHILVTSDELLNELSRVLQRPRLQQRFQLDDSQIYNFFVIRRT